MALVALQIQSCSQAGCQRLFNQEHPSGTGLDGGVDDAALLDFGDAAGNADDHTGLRCKHGSLGGGFEHLLEHAHGHLMVGDHTLPQRPHGNHVAGSAVQHIPGSRAHLKYFAGVAIQRNHRRLPNHKALSVGINQNIGGTQVNAQVIGKKLHSIHPLGYFL